MEEKSDLSFYIFVVVSSVIGFIAVLFSGRAIINLLNEKNIVNLISFSSVLSIVVASICVVFFIFISLLFKKYLKPIFMSEIFMYLYMGFLTTVVNIVSFQLIDNAIEKGQEGSLGWKVAEILAFIIALIFAFVTNKIFVFRSYKIEPRVLLQEAAQFTGARLITEFLNVFIMWMMIDNMKINTLLSKIVASIVVIILNYIFSKFIIFKRSNE